MKKSMIQKILALPFSKRQKILAKNRPRLSHADFTRAIVSGGGDEQAADLVRTKLQDWIYNESFSPYPEDSLSSVFGIAEEELDEDLILDVLMKLGVPTPSQQDVEAFGPIDTALDVARLVALARSRGSDMDCAS
jgi:hypothetical protein